MKNNRVIAQTYGKALLEALGSESEIDHGIEVLRELSNALNASDELYKLVENPMVKLGDKEAILSDILALVKADEKLVRFVNILLKNDRLVYISMILDEFEKMADESLNRGMAKVQVAQELTPADQKVLTEKLEKIVGKKVKLSFEVDERILGGFSVTLGNKVLDYSVKGQVERLEQIVTKMRVR